MYNQLYYKANTSPQISDYRDLPNHNRRIETLIAHYHTTVSLNAYTHSTEEDEWTFVYLFGATNYLGHSTSCQNHIHQLVRFTFVKE